MNGREPAGIERLIEIKSKLFSISEDIIDGGIKFNGINTTHSWVVRHNKFIDGRINERD